MYEKLITKTHFLCLQSFYLTYYQNSATAMSLRAQGLRHSYSIISLNDSCSQSPSQWHKWLFALIDEAADDSDVTEAFFFLENI